MTDDEKDRYIEEQDRVIDQLTVRVIELQNLLEQTETQLEQALLENMWN